VCVVCVCVPVCLSLSEIENVSVRARCVRSCACANYYVFVDDHVHVRVIGYWGCGDVVGGIINVLCIMVKFETQRGPR